MGLPYSDFNVCKRICQQIHEHWLKRNPIYSSMFVLYDTGCLVHASR